MNLLDQWTRYEAITRQILEQPDGLGYVVLDEKIEDVPNYRVAVRPTNPRSPVRTYSRSAGS
jgi:tricarballylate dehydrogenase